MIYDLPILDLQRNNPSCCSQGWGREGGCIWPQFPWAAWERHLQGCSVAGEEAVVPFIGSWLMEDGWAEPIQRWSPAHKGPAERGRLQLNSTRSQVAAKPRQHLSVGQRGACLLSASSMQYTDKDGKTRADTNWEKRKTDKLLAWRMACLFCLKSKG